LEPNMYLNMKKIGYAIAFCFMVGIYGCSQNDAGTNNSGNNAASGTNTNKDSLLKAASKLNAADSGKGTVKDSTPKSH